MKGYIYVILAAAMWATSGTAAKFLFNDGITAFQLVQLRITISAAVLLLWFALRAPKFLKISKKDILYFIILGTLGMAGVQFAYLFAISKIKVAVAILLEYLAPVFITLYSLIFLREKPSLVTISALIISTAGCYLVVGAYNLDILSMNRSGIISGIMAAVAFAWYSLHGEHGMRRYNPWTVLFYSMFFAALVWNIIHPPLEAFIHVYTPVQWLWILYIGIIGTIIPFALYYQGINLIRSAKASITATLEPILAGVISYLFLNEQIEIFQIIGGIMVITAVIVLQLSKSTDDKTPNLIRQQDGQSPSKEAITLR